MENSRARRERKMEMERGEGGMRGWRIQVGRVEEEGEGEGERKRGREGGRQRERERENYQSHGVGGIA